MKNLKQKVLDRLRRAYEMGEVMGDLVLDDLSRIEKAPAPRPSARGEIIKKLKILRGDSSRHLRTVEKILVKYGG